MKAIWKKHVLHFNTPGGTSRGILNEKETYFLLVDDDGNRGIGECGILRGLSADDRPDYEQKLDWVTANIDKGLAFLYPIMKEWPSIQFGLEQAFHQLENKGSFRFFETPFSAGERGIGINGLIWMGDAKHMTDQIEKKLDEGFSCLKLKIGAIEWGDEYKILKDLRSRFDSLDLEIRVDANGAFSFTQAEKVLDELASLEIHSIEQPIKPGQLEEMALLVEESVVPIALDEELIGIYDRKERKRMLEEISPDYIVLKPSFIGGWRGAEEWIELAEDWGVDWWVTSALESNIGLNAIAQWLATKNLRIPQGLGTGGLFTNNIPSPLEVSDAQLWYNAMAPWDTGLITD
jgi:O-succinylbenzoate synthase